jgi:hypothetical protein
MKIETKFDPNDLIFVVDSLGIRQAVVNSIEITVKKFEFCPDDCEIGYYESLWVSFSDDVNHEELIYSNVCFKDYNDALDAQSTLTCYDTEYGEFIIEDDEDDEITERQFDMISIMDMDEYFSESSDYCVGPNCGMIIEVEDDDEEL